ncbi:thioredoxin family protein [Enterococcus thailandicus]|nr:thioredoxin family protein [Enterococcus thailandicus]MDA3964540.1 thioredoxin family protein [Enterococcus thailandicus]MDT2751219.1 thioredoxin family protein [Enterococcus thailandicus]MDT2775454.1 thioredoxin family protein [Enterococcus thailandicus]MDT2794324.1 thioredoxin family protein [Enterococcus thailandicus]MDT2845418.1 thioredoxin family protein [Enterococcus thailandicus]
MKKKSMRRRRFVFVIFCLVFLITMGGGYFIFYFEKIPNILQHTNSEKIELKQNMQEEVKIYDEKIANLEDKNKLIIMNSHELYLLNQDNILLYFGRNDCSVCQGFLQTLTPILEHTDRKIYYFDTNDKDNLHYEELINEYGITQVPTLVRLNHSEGKKIVFNPEKDGLASFIKKGV